MRPMTLAGMALVVGSLSGALSTELIGHEYDHGQGGEKNFVLAVSIGEQLQLMSSTGPRADADEAGRQTGPSRQLTCRRILQIPALTIGLRCQ